MCLQDDVRTQTCEGCFSAKTSGEFSMKFLCFCLATEIQLGGSVSPPDILPTGSEEDMAQKETFYTL